MHDVVLVIGGQSWQTGYPGPLLTVFEELNIDNCDIVPIPYKGFTQLGTFHSMINTIVKAIDDNKKPDRKLYLAGYSAGGQLAVMALKQRAKDVAGVITVSAPLDFAEVPKMPRLVGLALSRYNPIYFAPSIKTPMLILHGRQDTTVLPAAAMNFYKRIKGPNAALLESGDCGHTASLVKIFEKEVKEFIK